MTKPFEDRQTSSDQLTIVETYDEYSSNDSDDEALRTKRAKKWIFYPKKTLVNKSIQASNQVSVTKRPEAVTCDPPLLRRELMIC